MPPQAMVLSVAAMWLVAVAIPGPNFFVVARMAALGSRRAGMAAVAAIGIGSALWGLAGFFGVQALFVLAPRLYLGLRLVGAGYLLIVGARLLRAGKMEPAAAEAAGGAFRTALTTSLSNPKSALLVGSLFTALVPPDAPVSVGLLTVGEMVCISMGWYAVVASVIAAPPVARRFRQVRGWIDRGAGVIFIGFGVRIVVAAFF